MFKKILSVLLVSLVLLTALASCTGKATDASSTGEAESASTEEAKDALAVIQERGKLIVGINAEFAPYEFHAIIDGQDTIAGFDADLAKEIAKDMGVELEFKELAFDALLTTLGNGQVDVLISALSATEERRQSVDFSDAYYKGDDVVLVHKDNLDQFNSFDDLSGKKVGLQLSSLQDSLMTDLLPKGNFTRIESMNTLFLSLQSKQLDAIVTSGLVSRMAVEANSNFAIAESIEIDNSSLNSPGIGVVIPYGDEYASLKVQVNSSVGRLLESGEMDKFVNAACELAASLQE